MSTKLLFSFCLCLFVFKTIAQSYNYNWSGNAFVASATQAKRYTIGRVYYNEVNWGYYSNMKIKLKNTYFSSGNLEYIIQNQSGVASIYCTSAFGSVASYANVSLSNQISAGTSSYGGNNVYREIYLDVDYYTNWVADCEITGSFQVDKYSVGPYADYGFITLFSAPQSQDIASFYAIPKQVFSSSGNHATIFGGYIYVASTGLYSPTKGSYLIPASTGWTVQSSSPSIADYELKTSDGITRGYIGANNTDVVGGFRNPAGSWVFYSDYNGLITANGANFTSTVNGKNASFNGLLKTKKLIVTQLGWSDYVFNKNYKLRPLSDVEDYIKANQHLPEVPSAKEVAIKGISVGDIQALLLKKIEELTLYIIELKKENVIIKKEFELVKNSLNKQ